MLLFKLKQFFIDVYDLLVVALMFVIILAMSGACRNGENTHKNETNQTKEQLHMTCFSGDKVIYEGDVESSDHFRSRLVDTKTGLRFRFWPEHGDDCYWADRPFYQNHANCITQTLGDFFIKK